MKSAEGTESPRALPPSPLPPPYVRARTHGAVNVAGEARVGEQVGEEMLADVVGGPRSSVPCEKRGGKPEGGRGKFPDSAQGIP